MKNEKILKNAHLRKILNLIPIPVFVMDNNLVFIDANTQAERFIGKRSDFISSRLCGDILHCRHALESGGGCGTMEICSKCVIRNAVQGSYEGKRVFRERYRMQVQRDGTADQIHLLVTAEPFDMGEKVYSLLTLEDVTELVRLRQLLPICSHCKKIRKDDKYWEDVDKYIHEHLNVEFSHSICPDCVKKLYPDIENL